MSQSPANSTLEPTTIAAVPDADAVEETPVAAPEQLDSPVERIEPGMADSFIP
jgi:hypothetical protein